MLSLMKLCRHVIVRILHAVLKSFYTFKGIMSIVGSAFMQFTELSGRCSVFERPLSDAKRPLIFN